jgi:cofilin
LQITDSMADLGALRSAKQALDEGLITPQDFDVVKVAFLKAQQIKAGLDAGFIRKEDYDKAVDAYIHALDFNVMATLPSLSAGGRPAAAAAPATAQTANHVQQQQQPNPMAAAFGGSRGTSLAGAAAAAGAVGSMGAIVQLLPGGRSSGSGAHGFDGMASGPLSNQTSVSEDGGMLDIPADLPDYCKGATAGKVGSRAGLSHLGLAVSNLQHPVVATCVSYTRHQFTGIAVLSN